MMPTFDSGKPRSGAKGLGILLAVSLVIAALVLAKSYLGSYLALPSPRPAKAAIIAVTPDLSEKKMIRFRGKVFVKYEREIAISHPGRITKIEVTEGKTVRQGEVLAEYILDRISMERVYEILRGEQVLDLRHRISQLAVTIDKLKNVDLPLDRLKIEKAEDELNLLRKLLSRRLAPPDAITLKERELIGLRKAVQATRETIKQSEAAFKSLNQDLRFAENHQKRALKLLEWEVGRSYSNPKIPLNRGFLRAPISGQVIWMNPMFRTGAEVRHLARSRGPRKDPNLGQVGSKNGMTPLRVGGNGGASQNGFLAMTIAPLRQFVIRGLVHELDLVKLKAGDKGTVTFDAFPESEFSCRIDRIPWVSISNVIEVPASYDVECVVDEPMVMLREGLTCSVEVPLERPAQPHRGGRPAEARAQHVSQAPSSSIRVISDVFPPLAACASGPKRVAPREAGLGR